VRVSRNLIVEGDVQLAGADLAEEFSVVGTLTAEPGSVVVLAGDDQVRVSDKPYARELYQWPGVRQTTNFAHIKRHYYQSHETINPTRIVPIGPVLDFDQAHDRNLLMKAA
jgi:hypothetical protein